MSPGNVAADALLARRGRPPTPPGLTLVATDGLPVCSRCRQPAARLVPGYWGRSLCPSCCVAVAAEFDAGSWPVVPAVPLDGPRAGVDGPSERTEPSDPHSKNVLQTASPLVSSPPAEPVVLPAPHERPGGDR